MILFCSEAFDGSLATTMEVSKLGCGYEPLSGGVSELEDLQAGWMAVRAAQIPDCWPSTSCR